VKKPDWLRPEEEIEIFKKVKNQYPYSSIKIFNFKKEKKK
jgi:hypothetical protein